MISFMNFEKCPRYSLKINVSHNTLKVQVIQIVEEVHKVITTSLADPTKDNPHPKPVQTVKDEMHTRAIPWPEWTFKLSELKEQSTWAEGSILNFCLNTRKMRLVGPIPLPANLLSRQAPDSLFYSQQGLATAFSIFVPFKDAGFDDCGIAINMRKGEKIDCNMPVVEQNHSKTFLATVPKIKIEGPTSVKSGALVQMKVSVLTGTGGSFNRPVSVYLEPLAGYLPKTRVDIQDGKGSLTAMALGLEPGEKMRIRAGFRFYSNAEEHDVSVI